MSNSITINIRKDGRYMARQTVEGIKNPLCAYGKTEKEAKHNLEEKKKLYYQGKLNPNTITLDKFFLYWLETFKKNKLKESTYRRYKSTYTYHIGPYIGYMQLRNITVGHIQDIIKQETDKGSSYSSIKKIKELLNLMFDKAIILKYVLESPLNGLELPESSEKEILIYTDEHIANLKKAIESSFDEKRKLYRYSPIFVFMLNTGLRKGEVLALTWDDIDFESETVHISKTMNYIQDKNTSAWKYELQKPKTKSSTRIIPLNETAICTLNEIKRRNQLKGIDSPFVVCGENGDFIKERRFSNMLERVCNKADIPYYGVHALRHTFCSALIRKGINIKVVSQLMGHKNISITYNRYVHIIDEQRTLAIKQIAI